MTSNEDSQRVAVLAGASGLVGSHLLPLLVQSPVYSQVIALVRRPLDLQDPKLRPLTVNFKSLPRLTEFNAADVFCALGTTMKLAGSREAFRQVDYDAGLAYATIAAAGGARQFLLVSSIGANSSSSTFYLQVKGQLEDALKALPFSTVHIFRPSFLLGDRTSTRPVERIGTAVTRALDFALPGKLKKYSPVEACDLASAMLHAAARLDSGVHIHEYEQILALAAG